MVRIFMAVILGGWAHDSYLTMVILSRQTGFEWSSYASLGGDVSLNVIPVLYWLYLLRYKNESMCGFYRIEDKINQSSDDIVCLFSRCVTRISSLSFFSRICFPFLPISI
jgi:hypothetical protein